MTSTTLSAHIISVNVYMTCNQNIQNINYTTPNSTGILFLHIRHIILSYIMNKYTIYYNIKHNIRNVVLGAEAAC